jgi:hypothetical protein
MTKTKETKEPTNREQALKRARQCVKNISASEIGNESLLLDVDKKVTAYRDAQNNDEISDDEYYECEQDVNKVLMKAMGLTNLKTHSVISKTVRDMYRPMVAELSEKLIAEYSAETPSEIMLAQMAASAYGRYIEHSSMFSLHGQQDGITDTKNAYFSLFSKEADRAFRHFQSSISLLKQIKAPSINVTVKTKTAFIAQNQQVNAVESESNPSQYEINESK